MLEWLKPDLAVTHPLDVDWKRVRSRGIRVLLCDVDNTLIPHDHYLPEAWNKELFAAIQQAGIQVVLVSNNTKRRLAGYAQQVGLPFYSFALKPWPMLYRKARKVYGIDSSELAVLGDQLFTDILGGILNGAYTILCEPREARDIVYTVPMRYLEKALKRHQEKKRRQKHGTM